MSRILPEELDERRDELFVLDVRPERGYERRHVEGSHNVPVYDDLQGGDEDAYRRVAEAVPDDAEVVTVCKVGVVAKRATRHLREEGHEARTLAGGMRAWRGYRDGTLLYRLRTALRGLLS